MIEYIRGDIMANDTLVDLEFINVPIMPPITSRMEEVLCFLAKNGPANTYQIHKGLNIEYSVAYMAVKSLQGLGFIKLEGRGQGQKGATTLIYGLTLKGLIKAIFSRNNFENLDNIFDRWKHLAPLIFGKWIYFKKMQLRDDIIEFLCDRRIIWENLQISYRGKDEISSDKIAEDFFMSDLASWIFRKRLVGNRDKWLRALRGDEELRKWMISYLEMEVKKHQYLIQITIENLALLRDLRDLETEVMKNV
jgi:predicted transcriptional regulator